MEEGTGTEKVGKEGRGRERTGSVGVLEMWKRKREVEEERGETVGQGDWKEELALFKRSKKTTRSPEKEGEGLMMMGVIKK
jgi:hypothetical protein